ncbi:MAG: site-2 protease family protein [Cyanobacteria bacterium SZAS LIN-3]|nr:site-2 protease family protein [Cyanobacteria bacterium SZAS LIN-3]MBS2010906.1 site-2 protease family protein [Cyanobacteria bacterium SZAS TMP-1]
MSQDEGPKMETPGGKHKSAILGGLGVLGLGALKFKAFGLVLLKMLSGFKFLYVFKSFLSMFLMIGLYTMTFGWVYAVIVVGLILIHEMGHFIFMKAMNLDPKLPIFVPFMGAYVAMDKMPPDQTTHAWVALAGPLVGGVTSLAFYYYGVVSHTPFLMAAGNTGIFLNVLQLIPAKPFDGGFVLHAVSKWLLIPGTGLAFLFGVMFQSPIFLIIAVISLFTTYSAIKTQPAPDGTILGQKPATTVDKFLIGTAYFTLMGVLGFIYWFSHNDLITIVAPK